MPRAKGLLRVITGPMFSGKTELLLLRLDRYRISGLKVLLFKPAIDTRLPGREVTAHRGKVTELAYIVEKDQETLEGLLAAIAAVEGRDKALKILQEADAFLFEEGQFFNPLAFYNLCDDLLRAGKEVIVAGLDLTYEDKPFGPMPMLLALADRVEKLTAVCKGCNGEATRTLRVASSTDVVLVGSEGEYRPVCLQCKLQMTAATR